MAPGENGSEPLLKTFNGLAVGVNRDKGICVCCSFNQAVENTVPERR